MYALLPLFQQKIDEAVTGLPLSVLFQMKVLLT